MNRWVVYIVRCRDGTLYTGITNDLERRLAAHDAGRGARYTRGRGPVALVYLEDCGRMGDALRREAVLRRLSPAAKLALAPPAAPARAPRRRRAAAAKVVRRKT